LLCPAAFFMFPCLFYSLMVKNASPRPIFAAFWGLVVILAINIIFYFLYFFRRFPNLLRIRCYLLLYTFLAC